MKNLIITRNRSAQSNKDGVNRVRSRGSIVAVTVLTLVCAGLMIHCGNIDEETTYGTLELSATASDTFIAGDDITAGNDLPQTAELHLVDLDRAPNQRCTRFEEVPKDADYFQSVPIEVGGTRKETIPNIETGKYCVTVVGRNREGVLVSAASVSAVIRDGQETPVALSLRPQPTSIDGRYETNFDIDSRFGKPDSVSRVAGVACNGIISLGDGICRRLGQLQTLLTTVEVDMDWDCDQISPNATMCEAEVLRVQNKPAKASCNFLDGRVRLATRGATVYDRAGSSIRIDGLGLTTCLQDMGLLNLQALGLTQTQADKLARTMFGDAALHLVAMRVTTEDREGATTVDVDMCVGREPDRRNEDVSCENEDDTRRTIIAYRRETLGA